MFTLLDIQLTQPHVFTNCYPLLTSSLGEWFQLRHEEQLLLRYHPSALSRTKFISPVNGLTGVGMIYYGHHFLLRWPFLCHSKCLHLHVTLVFLIPCSLFISSLTSKMFTLLLQPALIFCGFSWACEFSWALSSVLFIFNIIQPVSVNKLSSLFHSSLSLSLSRSDFDDLLIEKSYTHHWC